MRSVSLSKYLSKSIHFLTAFVYLFTFLGPSLALATRTQHYEPSYAETSTAQRRSSHSDHSSKKPLEKPDQKEQHINISKGWGDQSLYFGVEQNVQHLISPLALLGGNLPYEEVIEDDLSLGFRGDIAGLGQFICCWDGQLLLQGTPKKRTAQGSLTTKETDTQALSVEALESLVLETFAPVTFSNFIAKSVKATAERIFFRGNNALEEATLIPTSTTDLEAFCQVSRDSSVSIEDLVLHRGTLTNFGSFSAERATIGQGASFVNGRYAHIKTLQGQGLFLNHGTFEGLIKTSILRFINRTNAFFAPRAKCDFKDVSVAGITSQFLNDEDALLEADTLVFEGNPLFRPSSIQNKGDFVVRGGMTLKGRGFVNEGSATLAEVDLQNKARLINKKYQTISGIRSLKLSQGSTVKNAGTFATQGVVAYDIFMLLANQEDGHWDHEGDVELDAEKTAITGSVSLKNGFFLTDGWRDVTNTGNLKLHAFSNNTGSLSIHNKGKLVLSGLSKESSEFAIYNKQKAHLRLTDNQRTTKKKVLVSNQGIVRLSSTNRLTYQLTNKSSGRVHFEKGIHRLAHFDNKGDVDFADANWHLGQESPSNPFVFASDEFLDDVDLLDHIDFPEGTKAPYHVSGSLIFPQDLTFRLACSPETLEVLGDLHLPLMESKHTRSLADLKDVTCHGETHVALPSLTLTEDLTLEKLRSLHITCADAIRIQAHLEAYEIFMDGQKGFDLGTDNTHFGEVFAVSGRLDITVQDALNAKYGNLYSKQKMVLRSEKDRVDLGEMILTDPDAQRWLGYAHNSRGNVATTKFYSPNGSMISSSATVHIIGKQAALTGAKIYTGRDLFFTCEQDVDIITSLLEGQGKCVFEAPKTSLHRKDKKYLHVASWGCDNACGYTWKTYGNAIMSDQAVVNFKEEIDFQSQEVFLSSCALHAGTDITYLPGANKTIDTLTETSASLKHGCKHHKRRRDYCYNSTTSKTYPTVEQSGQEIIMNLGDGTFVGLNLNTQRFTFRAQTASFKNPTTRRETVEQVAIEVDLPTYLRELTRQGATMLRLGDDGGISPVLPLAGTPAATLSDLPIVCAQPWQSLDDVEGFNPLQDVPLEMLMQRAMGRFAGQLHMGGLSGGRLFENIYDNSRDFFRKHATDGRELTDYRGALESSSVPLLYYMSKLVDSRKEVHLHLHIPEESVNPYQDAGDISSTDINMETVGDLSLEGTRTVGKNDVFMTSTKGGVDRRGYVDRQGQREFAGCANEVISTDGSVMTQTKTHISDRHSKIKAKKKITQKTEGTLFHGTNIVHDHTSDGRTTRDTVTHLQSQFEGEEILNDGGRLIEQAPILKAEKKIHYKLQEGIESHSATNSVHEETHRKKKKALGGSSRRDEVLHTEDVLRPEYHGPQVTFETQKENISLEAPLIKTKVLEFKAPEGKLILKAALKSFLHSVQTTDSSFAWNKMVNKGKTSTTVVGADIEGESFLFDLKDGVEYSLRADQQAAETHFHEALKKQKNVIWQAIQDEEDSWYDCQESLGVVPVAIIGIVVSWYTAGMGAKMIAPMIGAIKGTAAAAMLSAAANVAVCSLSSQAAVSFISNKGDLGSVAKDLTSSQALKSLAVSMISAGILEGLDIQVNTTGSVGEQMLSRGQEAAIRAGVNTVLKSTIEGRKFSDALREEARSGAANVVGGTFANKLGIEYKAKDSDINKVMHKIIHGVIGGVSGFISGGTEEAFAAAIGATVGEIIGEGFEKAHRDDVYDPNHPMYDAEERQAMVKKGTMYAQISAATVAGLLGQDPNAAARAANTAVTENSFSIKPTLQRQTVEETGEIIGYVLENSPAETTEELAGDFYEVLSNLKHLDLSDDQAGEIATSLAEKISEHGDSLSGRQLNKLLQKSLLEHAGPTAEQKKFEKDLGNLGQLGGQKGVELLGGSENLQSLTGELGKLAGTGLAFGMGLYDNPASSGAKKAVKETAKGTAKETAKGGKFVKLTFKAGMEKKSFDRKKKLLQKAGEKGKLQSNKSHGVSPAERRQLTRNYRRDLKVKIDSIYSKNPEARKSALQKLKRADIDHKIDLQLGGKNTRKNLKTLDSSTNRSLGAQIAQQLPKEKGIEIKIINSKKGPKL